MTFLTGQKHACVCYNFAYLYDGFWFKYNSLHTEGAGVCCTTRGVQLITVIRDSSKDQYCPMVVVILFVWTILVRRNFRIDCCTGKGLCCPNKPLRIKKEANTGRYQGIKILFPTRSPPASESIKGPLAPKYHFMIEEKPAANADWQYEDRAIPG